MNIEQHPDARKTASSDWLPKPASPIDLACALDRIADAELSLGRRKLAERLSHRAAELREVSR